MDIAAAEDVLVTGVVAALWLDAERTRGGLPERDKLPRRRDSEFGVEGFEEVGGWAVGVAVALVPVRLPPLVKCT